VGMRETVTAAAAKRSYAPRRLPTRLSDNASRLLRAAIRVIPRTGTWLTYGA